MTQIHVDPKQLAKAAQSISDASDRLRSKAEEVAEASTHAPEYDGQFGPQVRGLAFELHSPVWAQADQLVELSQQLGAISQAFAEADSQSQEGIFGLGGLFRGWLDRLGIGGQQQEPSGTSMWATIDARLGLGGLLLDGDDPSDGDGWDPEPWFESMLLKVNAGWEWFDQEIGAPIRETIYGAPEQWNQNAEYARTIVLLGLAIGWRKLDEGFGQPLRETVEQLPVRQEPGLPPDGPISGAMQYLSRVDDDGNPVSVVGTELAGLIDGRGGVSIMFSDNLTNGGTAGVAPVKGLVWLPESYESPAEQMEIGKASLIAHELDHILQRDLPEFPSGLPSVSLPFAGAGSWPFGPGGFQPIESVGVYGFPIAGDFTLYMEVQSNIVAGAIEYDLLAQEIGNHTPDTPAYNTIEGRMETIQNSLATFTGEAENAVAYVVDRYAGRDPHGMYLGEFVREVASGGRIPEGGWQLWLGEQGFSQAAIDHIDEIAQGGTAHEIPIAGFLREEAPPGLAIEPGTVSTPLPSGGSVAPVETPVPEPVPEPKMPEEQPVAQPPPGTPEPGGDGSGTDESDLAKKDSARYSHEQE
jgi:hypothetical protein